MSEAKAKILKTRVQNKHDIEANWNLAVNFKPLAGEIIVYDPDATHSLPRVKIGDGVNTINDLEFIDADLLTAINSKADTGHTHPSDTTKVSHEELAAHAATTSHITAAERAAWNASLISCGTADPSSSITSKFYFKYSTN